MSGLPKTTRKAGGWLNVVLLLVFLYLFMSSINLMGGGFKLMGKGLGDKLLTLTSNPFAGLMVGVLTGAFGRFLIGCMAWLRNAPFAFTGLTRR